LNKIDDQLHQVSELIRRVSELITPDSPMIDYNYELSWLMKQDNRNTLFEKNPFCMIPLKIGRLVPFFPICSRSAVANPRMIDFSLKLANRLQGNERICQESLQEAIKKLEDLKSKYSKKI